MNLILVDAGEVHDAGGVTLTGVRAAHVRDVLHAIPGQQIRVGLIDGPAGIGTVDAIERDRVMLRCVFDGGAPPRPRIDLLLAVPRPKVLRRLWAPLASLGVGQIILTNASRVERPYFDTHVLDEAHYRPLLVEGLQQARDTRLPAVSIHRQFRILVEEHLIRLFPDGGRLVADSTGTTPVASAARGAGAGRLLLAVGPEGGWNPFELELLRAHGFALVGLGPRTLRVDTACIALLAIVRSALPPGV